MLVLHDDATREYAYGPAQGLPDTKVGTFTPRRSQHEERLEEDFLIRVGSRQMSDLVVIAFPTEAKAEEVRQKLLTMRRSI